MAVFTALTLELASVILWRLALVRVPGENPASQPVHSDHIEPDSKPPVQASSEPVLQPVLPEMQEELPENGPEALQTLEPAMTSDVPVLQPDLPGDADAQTVLSVVRSKGAVTVGTLQAGISKRLRPVLADLLAALETAGQIRVTQQGRGKLVELVS